LSCGLSPYRYSNYSRFKYDVAMWHLLNFDRALEMVPSSVILVRFGEEHPLAAVWGHADGIVLQLHAAFDSWACSLAHRCGWQSSDQASFGQLATSPLPRSTEMKAVRRVLDPILSADEWVRLVELRNRAAHRTIVGESLRLNDEGASVAYFDQGGQGAEVLPELRRLASWADGPLEWMWQIAEAWRQPDEDSVIGMRSDRHAERSGAADRLRRQLGL
jgi:hypothetical protein